VSRVTPLAPPLKVRDPVDANAARVVFPRLWDQERYRQSVEQAFEDAVAPYEHLYLARTPETDVWISYVLDGAQRTINVVSIDTVKP
jgi:hypothetical protein